MLQIAGFRDADRDSAGSPVREIETHLGSPIRRSRLPARTLTRPHSHSRYSGTGTRRTTIVLLAGYQTSISTTSADHGAASRLFFPLDFLRLPVIFDGLDGGTLFFG